MLTTRYRMSRARSTKRRELRDTRRLRPEPLDDKPISLPIRPSRRNRVDEVGMSIEAGRSSSLCSRIAVLPLFFLFFFCLLLSISSDYSVISLHLIDCLSTGERNANRIVWFRAKTKAKRMHKNRTSEDCSEQYPPLLYSSNFFNPITVRRSEIQPPSVITFCPSQTALSIFESPSNRSLSSSTISANPTISVNAPGAVGDAIPPVR